MKPRKRIQLDDYMTERISRRVDKMTGDEAWKEVNRLLDQIPNRELSEELWLAICGYGLEQISAAFRLGLEVSQAPAVWIFESAEL